MTLPADEIDPDELRGVVTTPGWLRDLGVTAWLLVGLILLVVGAVWILSLTHPLAVLIVTIAGGALFGAAGLILAAPLTSAVVRISADLARARGNPTVPAPTVPAPTVPA